MLPYGRSADFQAPSVQFRYSEGSARECAINR